MVFRYNYGNVNIYPIASIIIIYIQVNCIVHLTAFEFSFFFLSRWKNMQSICICIGQALNICFGKHFPTRIAIVFFYFFFHCENCYICWIKWCVSVARYIYNVKKKKHCQHFYYSFEFGRFRRIWLHSLLNWIEIGISKEKSVERSLLVQ